MGHGSINTSVVRGGAALAALTVLAGGLGIGATWTLGRELAKMESSADVLRDHMRADMMHDALRGDVYASLLKSRLGLSDEDLRAELDEHAKTFRESIASAKSKATPEVAAILTRVEPAIDAYVKSAGQIVDAAAKDPASVDAQMASFVKAFGDLEALMEQAGDEIQAAASAQSHQAHQMALFSKIAVALSMLLTGALVMALVVLSRRKIIEPLVDLEMAMRALAGGDTSHSPSSRGRDDEIGRMADAYERFRENVIERDSLNMEKQLAEEREAKARAFAQLTLTFSKDLDETLTALARAIDVLHADASTMRQTSDRTRHIADGAAGSAAGASADVQSIAAAATELSASIDEISARVSESASLAGDAANTGRTANDTILELAGAANKIGQVVSLIRDIAEQTNLLALNATIEAARAGGAGRGFAVVAGEVKALATQTARATEDISGSIVQMQSISERSVREMKAMIEMIERVRENCSALAAAVEEQSAATGGIAENVSNAASGSANAAENAAEVRGLADACAQTSANVAANAAEVSTLGDRLRSSSQTFVNAIKAA